MLSLIKSKILSHVNYFHFYAILILFIYLTFINVYYIIVLIIYLIYLYKIHFINLKLIIFSSIFIISFTTRYSLKNVISKKDYYDFKIKEVYVNTTYNKYIVTNYNQYIIVYDYEMNNYIPGDNVRFYGSIKEISNNSDFDYVSYMKSYHIYYSLSLTKSEYLSHNNDLYYLRYKIENRYNDINGITKMYLKSLVLGKDITDIDLSNNINELGISYLFVISGFHISLLALLLTKLLSIFNKNEFINDIIIIFLLLIYGVIIGFEIGILRAYLMFVISKINRYKNLDLTKLDILSITFLSLLLINPLYFFRLSFKYSFISTLFIILGSTLIKIKNRIISSYLITILCFVSTLPLSISINNQINILSIVISPFYLFIFSFILLPLLYFLAIFPYNYLLLNKVFLLFNDSIYTLSKYRMFIIKIKSMSPILIVLYYTLFLILLIAIESRKNVFKKAFAFSIYLLFIIAIKNIYPFTSISMINVGQGESILVRDKDYNMLIDSYGKNVEYLKSLGIEKLDVLLITHSDQDHIQTAKDVCMNFNVNTLIINKYEGDNINYLFNYVSKIKKIKGGDSFYFGTNIANVLGPINNIDINNNSLVFELNLKGIKVLFTGDMEIKEEDEIFNKKCSYDILKVPHHGSNTSMGKKFLENVSFKVCLISVGKNNKYNHPSIETMNKIKDKKVYITYESLSINIFITNNKYLIRETRKKRLILNYLDML